MPPEPREEVREEPRDEPKQVGWMKKPSQKTQQADTSSKDCQRSILAEHLQMTDLPICDPINGRGSGCIPLPLTGGGVIMSIIKSVCCLSGFWMLRQVPPKWVEQAPELARLATPFRGKVTLGGFKAARLEDFFDRSMAQTR